MHRVPWLKISRLLFRAGMWAVIVKASLDFGNAIGGAKDLTLQGARSALALVATCFVLALCVLFAFFWRWATYRPLPRWFEGLRNGPVRD